MISKLLIPTLGACRLAAISSQATVIVDDGFGGTEIGLDGSAWTFSAGNAAQTWSEVSGRRACK